MSKPNNWVFFLKVDKADGYLDQSTILAASVVHRNSATRNGHNCINKTSNQTLLSNQIQFSNL